MYSNIKRKNNIVKSQPLTPQINYHFLDGAFCEILSKKEDKYHVSFTDLDTNEIIHQDTITNNMWVKTARKYYTRWKIEVFQNDKQIFEHTFNLKNKNVFISLESKSIGDTLAWFPYVEEFRKKHECKVIVSTFHNKWFEDKYPKLKFINPGERIDDIYALYRIGWYHKENNEADLDKSPLDFKSQPLQKTSSLILGLEYKPIKPKLSFKKESPVIDGKYVCISPHASSHAKYWNYSGGWQQIIDYINSIGYKVMLISQEKLGNQFHDNKVGGKLLNVIDKTGDLSFESRASDLLNSSLFIGVGSGLAWLSWSLNVPTIMISGFSHPITEIKNDNKFERIFTPIDENPLLCNSCFNKERLNPSDWDWCPYHKGGSRMFECTKSITPEKVIETINKFLYEKN